MKKNLLIGLLVAALLGALASTSRASASPTTKHKPPAVPAKVVYLPVFHVPSRPCTDDSDDRNCYWDAGRRGDTAGYSYYVDRAGNVVYLDPKLNDPAKRKAWTAANKKAHREYWGTVWGHRLCWASVGDTSYVYCFDGHKETS
ncbi:hypothetical protein [Streptomyces sp. NRRL F-5123]|uniref:hypothetical protein n=1 Tax=Streptomyces sp. NRRL F-5123 TaxID=1463856 RepID=UPI0004E24E11|nr:hypothetical protein [Streptomyces sp. NRRL F-5123]